MRLTLALLFAWCAIYCGGGHNNKSQGIVLSLPPSLIANAAALRQHQLHQQHTAFEQPMLERLWKKDARVLLTDVNIGTAGGVLRQPQLQQDKIRQQSQPQWQQQQQRAVEFLQHKATPTDSKQAKLLNGDDLSASSVGIDPDTVERKLETITPQEIVPRIRALDELKYFTPYKYWSRHCQMTKNCPQEYYNTILAARRKADILQRLQHSLADTVPEMPTDNAPDSVKFPKTIIASHKKTTTNGNNKYGPTLDFHAVRSRDRDSVGDSDSDEDENDYGDDDNDYDDEDINNDIFMLLNGEQDLIKFLHWAMRLLYPYKNMTTNVSDDAADYYHPGMFIWRKLNLSGQLEPPLIVDEPQYLLVRRERLHNDLKSKGDDDDPFIPPRGRKHNAPDLDALMHRYEPFMPNRGKRDKIKDIFKYDDLFYPNRGKKELDFFKVDDDPFFPNRGKKKLQLRDIYNIDDPFFPNRGKRSTTDIAEQVDTAAVEKEISTVMNDKHLSTFADETAKAAPTTSLPPAPPSSMASMQRIYAKLKRKFQQQNVVANEMKSSNSAERMSTHKINGYDQSVKPSMSAASSLTAAAMPAEQRTAAVAATTIDSVAISDEGVGGEGGKLRFRRTATGYGAAARLAANRLHTTRSMSTSSSQLQRRQQQQQQRLTESDRQQRQTTNSATLQHQQQQQQPQSALRHYSQVKSYNNIGNLKYNDLDDAIWYWRQLQLARLQQQQNAASMQHSSQQQPREIQLTSRPFVVVNDGVESAGDIAPPIDTDIDYANFDIF